MGDYLQPRFCVLFPMLEDGRVDIRQGVLHWLCMQNTTKVRPCYDPFTTLEDERDALVSRLCDGHWRLFDGIGYAWRRTRCSGNELHTCIFELRKDKIVYRRRRIRSGLWDLCRARRAIQPLLLEHSWLGQSDAMASQTAH